MARVQKWIDWTLDHQRPDGAIADEEPDWWPNFVMLKALTQYQEATGDPRVIPLMERYFAYMSAEPRFDARSRNGLFSAGRTRFSAYCGCTIAPAIPELLDLARKLKAPGA